MYKNLGTANVNVKILDALPNVDDSKSIFFDITARSFDKKGISKNLPPTNLELVEDDSFAAVFPSKRKMFANNFLKNSKTHIDALNATDLNDKLLIDWTPTSTLPTLCALGEYFKKFPGLTHDPLKYEDQASYNGPIYFDSQIAFNPGPDDKAIIDQIRSKFSKPDANASAPVEPKEVDETTLPKMNVVWQRRQLAGMRWGLESNPFLKKNMPFWINLSKYQAPTTEKYPTIIVVSLGLDDDQNRFDIVISDNNKPFIIDYSISSDTQPFLFKEFDNDTSRILSSAEELEIGVMSIYGRLVVFVNKEILIYMKIDRTSANGTMIPFEIPPGKIAVYGTNISAYLHASPMIFSPYGLCELPIPNSKDPFRGVNGDGTEGDSIAKLPKPNTVKDEIYGVDCETFVGPGGSASPMGPGFHKHGKVEITFSKALANTTLTGADFYLMIMKSNPLKAVSSNGSEIEIKSGACPFFFRVKGRAFPEKQIPEGEGTDVSQYVLSVTENFSASDYSHIEKSASISFYNANGVMNSLLASQKGITISWGWNDTITKTFTGIITSCSTSQTPGMETITAECKDYWHILENKRIVNSPYYDGMLAIAVISDLATRAGISKQNIDWERENEYFLPQGLGLSDPKWKFNWDKSIKDCILEVLKLFQAFAYFNENGELSIEYIDGGWANKFTSSKADFVQGATEDGANVIIGEKNVSLDYSDVVNDISIKTLNRESKDTIIASLTAEAMGIKNPLLFRKTYFQDQPALASLEAAIATIFILANRMCYPPLKSNFKTIGHTTSILKPLDFITLNGQPFRVMSLKRSYNAESNDFTQDYDVEWIGGNGQGEDI